MAALDINISNIHFVLFIHDIKLDKINIAARINSINLFGEESTVLPLPDDAPAGIPRIILKGEEYQCQISNERVTFAKEPKEGYYQNTLPEYIDYCKQLVSMLVDMGFVISRMGIVVEGEIKVDPFKFVQENYFNNYSVNSDGFELGFLFHPVIKDLHLNKWVKVKSKEDKLLFFIDYNTLAETDIQFTVQQLTDLMDDLLEIFLGDQSALFQLGVIQ